MRYILATVATCFISLSFCLPPAPPRLDFTDESTSFRPCAAGDNTVQPPTSPSETNLTTSFCASGPTNWDAWQKIRVFTGTKGIYKIRAHPVTKGYLYAFEIQTSRKIDTLDIVFQDFSLAQYAMREDVMIRHNRFGPFTMEAAKDGWLFVVLHFRQSILPFWGKTRTVSGGRAPHPISN